MTRDERMRRLLDCVNFYAYNPNSYDKGRMAKRVLHEIAEDENIEGLKRHVGKRQPLGNENNHAPDDNRRI